MFNTLGKAVNDLQESVWVMRSFLALWDLEVVSGADCRQCSRKQDPQLINNMERNGSN